VHLVTDHVCYSVLSLSQVLRDEALRNYIDSNFVFWAGDVSNSEAFQIAAEMDVCDYPCMLVMGILNPGTNKPSLIDRIEGFRTSDQLMQALNHVVETRAVHLHAARLEE
jgi:hypothetical protein